MDIKSIEEFEIFNDKNFKKEPLLEAYQYDNFLETSINEVIIKLLEEIDRLDKEYYDQSLKLSDGLGIEHLPTDEDDLIIEELHRITNEQNWFKEQLYAINEMRAIYMFKTLEIKMKSLIKTAYPKVKSRDLYIWDNMNSFFQDKGIKLSDLSGYSEVIQLKKVNNNFKHSENLEDDVKNILGFTLDEDFAHKNYEAFFKRIEPKVIQFQKELSIAVVKELYDFDNAKLDQMTAELYDRMDRADAAKFVKKIQSKFLLE